MLVDHPEASRDRIAGRMEAHGYALDEGRPIVGLVQAGEDVHQRALAGAVLPEQRVDLAVAQVEIDMIVRDEAREALDDPVHLDREGCLGHSAVPRSWRRRWTAAGFKVLGGLTVPEDSE